MKRCTIIFLIFMVVTVLFAEKTGNRIEEKAYNWESGSTEFVIDNSRDNREVPNLIDYQGKFTDSSNNPITSDVSITFTIYDDATGGSNLWDEIHSTVTPIDGLVHVLLGSVDAFGTSLFTGSDLWLGINVNSDGEMSPRLRIVSVPYAIYAQTAETDNDWIISGDDIYTDNSGSVGIGTATPAASLDIQMSGNGLWQRAIRVLNPDMIANDGLFLVLGREDITRNVGYMYFRYTDDGSDLNRLSLGLYGVNDVINVMGSGNVGIGTTTPQAGLHLAGDDFPSSFIFIEAETGGDAGIRLYEDTTPEWHIYNNPANGGLQIQNNAFQTVIFADQTSANVGIGTITPTEMLEVAGTIQSTNGGFKFPDGSVQTTAAIEVTSDPAGTLNIGNLPAGSTYTSNAITSFECSLGDIVIGSINVNLLGCMMTTYVSQTNVIRISIFNGTGGAVYLGNDIDVKVYIVN